MNWKVLVQLSPDAAPLEWLCSVLLGSDTPLHRKQIQMAIWQLRKAGWGIQKDRAGYWITEDHFGLISRWFQLYPHWDGRNARRWAEKEGWDNGRLCPKNLKLWLGL